MPEDFDREFSVGSIEQDSGMNDPDAGDDVGRLLLIPTKGIAGFDEKMIFALAVSQGFCLGLCEKQNRKFLLTLFL